MRSRRKARDYSQGLDSLVDIVANNVGVLLILAVFMALIALINPEQPAELEARRLAEPPPKRIQVPWSHATNKNRVLFSIRRNRIQHFDMRAFFGHLGERPSGARPEPVTFESEGLTTRFFPITNQIYCLEFILGENAGETWLAAQKPRSDWRRARRQYSREKFTYFFWVTGDSFALFREVRDALWREQYEVGWKPVTPGGKIEVCNGFEGSATFQPQ